MKASSLCSTLLYYTVIIFLLLLILMNPLLIDDKDTHLQDIIPINVGIKRSLNPLSRHMEENPYKWMQITGASLNQNVYTYIQEEVFNEEKRAKISLEDINPFHKAMLLMGCYGDLWPKHKETVHADLGQVLIPDYEKPFMRNLILQALDDNYAQTTGFRGWDGSMHDRSACGCMKDFASPNLLQYKKALKCELKYEQDSCLVQNHIDYALDGDGPPVNGSLTQLQEMALINSKQHRRNRPDPLVSEYSTYLATLPAGKVSTNKGLWDFIDKYCYVIGYKNIEDQRIPDELLYDLYRKEQKRKCPSSWTSRDADKNVKHDKVQLGELEISAVAQRIPEWIAEMHTYNKMQTVKLRPISDTFINPPSLNDDGYKYYLTKYEAAMETCSHAGVPQYFERITNYTVSTNWHLGGELMLLLAASLAYYWGKIIEVRTKKHQASQEGGLCYEQAFSCGSDWLGRFSAIFPVGIAGLGFWRIAIFLEQGFWQRQEDKMQTVPYQQNEFLQVFVIIWWAFFVLACGMLVYFLYRMYSKGWPVQKNPEHDKALDQHLNQLAFVAQIAIDVPIILGLTFIAVGTALQQGVTDYYLIVTVILHFTVIGLIAHISNVLRILHLLSQWDVYCRKTAPVRSVSDDDDKTPKTPEIVDSIKFNRVAIGLVIALLLYAYLSFAGMDSIQGWSYGAQHQTIFAFLAFLILCVSDLTLEFMCLFEREPVESSHEHLYNTVKKKSFNTAWLILFSVLVLNLHLHTILCTNPGPLDGRKASCSWILREA